MSAVHQAGTLLLAALFAASATAQEHTHGPGGGLGTVHFVTSCSPAVAPQFDRAVALLHSFEFGAAIGAFRDVAEADSNCAMAHWGMALAHWTNPMAAANRPAAVLERGSRAVEAATRLAPRATDRERAYIAAVSHLFVDHERADQPTRVARYERAMAELVDKHPDDIEAVIFHALSLVAAASPTDKSYANLRAAGATLERLWASQPDHPGLAHYIIHSYDVPALAPQATAAARRYAAIAPAAAHALHMPSHTFTRLGMWEESVETNRRSADVALRDSALAEVLHAYDYMVYAHLQMRRDSAARAMLDRLPALAARFDPNAVTGAAPGSAGIFALAAMPARYALERRAWSEAAALEPKATAVAYADAMTYFARALGAARTGRRDVARAAIDSLSELSGRLASHGETYWAEQVAIQRVGARAWLELAEGRRVEALASMREAAEREDATEKSAVTPGPLAPARELLGDMLMELGRPAEALAEYRRTLVKEPRRYRALDGAWRAARGVNDREATTRFAEEIEALTGAGAGTLPR